MGLHFFKNAQHGGNWIIQERLTNSQTISKWLPNSAPLSTFRIITNSTGGLPSRSKQQPEIQSLSCVFRAGLKHATTDHAAILFNVDLQTGVISKGTTTNHWYRLGALNFLRAPFMVGEGIVQHPDSMVAIAGQRVDEVQEMCSMVENAHRDLMPGVPLVGWDVALTQGGMSVLEVNLSCNFFRGHFDRDAYFKFVKGYFVELEKLEFPEG